MPKKNGIPDRYGDYRGMGRPIPGTRFIAFKVPLKEDLASKADQYCDILTPRMVMDHCSRLGLIVDLTFTTRYYNPKEFKDNNIDYVKIFFPGRQIPKDAVIKKFFKKVDTFLEENKENDRLIGVHCTHGLNRTGYLICRYMIQRLKISPDQAIADFNSARGHEQEHKFFLEDLKCATWINDADGDDTAEEPETPESYNANNGYGFGYGKRRSNRFDEEDNQEYSRTPKSFNWKQKGLNKTKSRIPDGNWRQKDPIMTNLGRLGPNETNQGKSRNRNQKGPNKSNPLTSGEDMTKNGQTETNPPTTSNYSSKNVPKETNPPTNMDNLRKNGAKKTNPPITNDNSMKNDPKETNTSRTKKNLRKNGKKGTGPPTPNDKSKKNDTEGANVLNNSKKNCSKETDSPKSSNNLKKTDPKETTLPPTTDNSRKNGLKESHPPISSDDSKI